MEKLYSGNIFAGHYNFLLLDGNLDPDDWPIDWNLENCKIGYIITSSGRAIAIGTVADFNSHWIEVFLSTVPPLTDECERALVFNVNITSGELVLRASIYEKARLSISAGDYIVYILAYNLGLESEEELSDEELERRIDLERYKIVLVPGKTNNEGVIKGSKYLPDCVFDEE